MKGRVILEGVNIFWKFYISLDVVPMKQMDVVGDTELKWVQFLFEIEHHVVTTVYIWSLYLSWGGGGVKFTPLQVFLPVSTNINRAAPNFLCLICYYENMLW